MSFCPPKIFLTACIFLGTTGCSVLIPPGINTLGRVDKYTHTESGKEVVLVPMSHLNKPQRYAETKLYLDSLKADGYVTFFEAAFPVPRHIDTVGDVNYIELAHLYAEPLSAEDSLRLDTLLRKTRRILGFNASGGYTNTDNQSLPKRFRSGKYVSQTDELLGINTERDLWIDYSLSDLMVLYEKQCGEVPLTDYDFTTGWNEQYDSPGKRLDRNLFMSTLRDRYLRKRIAESPHPKIAVVYGLAHTWRLEYSLPHAEGFKKDRKYKAKKR